MKQALFSLIRTVVRSASVDRAPLVALTPLSNAQLRLVAGGANQVDSPKNVW